MKACDIGRGRARWFPGNSILGRVAPELLCAMRPETVSLEILDCLPEKRELFPCYSCVVGRCHPHSMPTIRALIVDHEQVDRS